MCLCSEGFDSDGLDDRSRCVKSSYNPSFVQTESAGHSDTQEALTAGDGGGRVGNEWLWGLGGFGVAVFFFFVTFFIRWLVKGRKRFSKAEQQSLIGESTYTGVAAANGSIRSGAVGV